MVSEKINRRNFITKAGAALASTLLPWHYLAGDPVKSTVWEIEGKAGPAVPELFDAIGGLQSILKKDPALSTIILKPNLCLPHKSSLGTTTSIELMDSICEYLIAEGVKKIIITDHTLQHADSFQRHEIVQLGKKYPPVKVILANEQRLYQPVSSNGKVLKEVEILKLIPRADLLLNLATAKHHTATHVTLAIKNLMGLIWDRSAFHTEMDLAQAIADLTLVIKPQLNIIDTSRVLLNGGPTGPGPIINENRLFASTDILAVDSIVAARYNFGGKSLSPKEIPHLRATYQAGIGEIDHENINLQKLKA